MLRRRKIGLSEPEHIYVNRAEMRESSTAQPTERFDGEVENPTTDRSTDQEASMRRTRNRKVSLIILILSVIALLTFRTHSTQSCTYHPSALSTCPIYTANGTITAVKGSTALMVSAYKDYRGQRAIRIIAVVNRHQTTPLYCVFCCTGEASQVTPATVLAHSVHYGYPYVAADILCFEHPGCNVTHVTVATPIENLDPLNLPFLSVQNREVEEVEEVEEFPFYLTVCMSSMFGDYNNVLQFVQTMEFYKLLGVPRVVLYLTSCGPDLEKVLQYYTEEGTLEVIDWPIDHFLKPATGWELEELEGDIHLNGQLTIMNECIYRNMYRSRYVLLADVEQLLVPVAHNSLRPLMEGLQGQHPDAAVFLMETHLFPATAGKAGLSAQSRALGVNLLDYVYREPLEEDDFRSHKMVVNPRKVLQTAIFEVTQSYGDTVRVPFDLCKIMQVTEAPRENWTKDQLVLDRSLWKFRDYLVPTVDEILQKLGFYKHLFEHLVL
ncbi:uncharacterized protein LOC105005813 isoform X1 [Esox lucius]|uniref:uncharacterized protein LOC105005813 isoform X1 n=2 Tax=Esox lucius TaxID=8010 RepID=UPI001476B6EF|nr:uncharacterized protein LOC105005813 isoform X1 [Esox lucius]XP_034145567.1 uncharacterized protein LOC105005813 isoform X1 [Esox lucius]